VEIFDILGGRIPMHRSTPIEVKFCSAKRTQVPVGPAKFDLNRFNSGPKIRKRIFGPRRGGCQAWLTQSLG